MHNSSDSGRNRGGVIAGGLIFLQREKNSKSNTNLSSFLETEKYYKYEAIREHTVNLWVIYLNLFYILKKHKKSERVFIRFDLVYELYLS